MTNAPVTDMTPMNAAKLKGLIQKYRETSIAAAIAFEAALAAQKTSRRRKEPVPPRPTLAELDAQRAAIDAEINRLYEIADNVYPQEMFQTFCETSQEVTKQAKGQLIELLAAGADGPGVQKMAALLCKYNLSVNEMVAFAEKRKELPSWAYLAALTGVGSMLMMNYLGNRKKPV